MPCNSDYLDPNEKEINLSKVYGLLDELETGVLPKRFGNGFDERAYCQASKEHLDQKTEELCSKLQSIDISKYSLEMQIWWRDHQKADRKRLEKEMKQHKEDSAREAALSKLTKYERRLLGLAG